MLKCIRLYWYMHKGSQGLQKTDGTPQDEGEGALGLFELTVSIITSTVLETYLVSA